MIAEVGTVLAMIVKGLDIAKQAVDVGRNAAPVIGAIRELAEAATNGPVTDEELAATEAILDAEIDEFNKPI